MSNNESARPTGGTAERAEAKRTGTGTISQSKFTTAGGNRQGGLVGLLPVGKSNALTARELAALLDTEPRSITKQIERLRQGGAPICASTDTKSPGFYIAGGPDELAEYLKALRRRLRNVNKTKCGLERTLDRWSGQTVLWEGL